jgi:hypothetical protein
MKRPWFIVSAAGLAVVAAVGSFLIAAPFAAPQAVAPAATPAWQLPQVSPLTALGEAIPDDGGLPATTVTSIDPSSLAVLDVQLHATLDALEAAAVSTDPEIFTLGPSAVSTLLPTPIDPCILLGTSTEGCDGAAATVLPIELPSDLQVRAQANATCASGPGESTVSFTVWVTDVGTVEVEYDVDGEPRWTTVRPKPEDLAAFEAEDRVGGWLRYCVQLTDLPADWSDTVIIRAQSELGGRADTEAAVSLASDDRVPPFWVEPITNTAVLVSVPTGPASVRFRAFVVPFGQPAPACDFDVDEALEPVTEITETVSPDVLRAGNFNSRYDVRHTALFVVPEASTIAFCAGVVNGRTSWPTNVPQELFSEVLHSPDLLLPRVKVVDWGLDESVESPNPLLTATIGGTTLECGTQRQTGNRDFVGGDGYLCDYETVNGAGVGWDSALVVTAQVSGYGSTGTRTYTLPVSPQLCGVGCVHPEPAYFDIPFESRNPCLGNGCAPSRVGVARLEVEWLDGQQSWATGWWREGAAERPEGPVFERDAVVELGAVSADGLSQAAQLRVRTNEPTTARLIVDPWPNSLLAVGGSAPTFEDLTFTTDRVIPFTVDTGQWYQAYLQVIDEDGNTTLYGSASAAPPTGAPQPRTWAGGYFRTDNQQRDYDITVTAVSTVGGPLAMSTPVVVDSEAAGYRSPTASSFTCSTVSSEPATVAGPEYGPMSLGRYLLIVIDARALSSLPESGAACENAARAPADYPNVLRRSLLAVPFNFGTTTTLNYSDFTYTVTISPSRPRG